MLKYIESSSNNTIKAIKKLNDKSKRYSSNRYLVEGINISSELFEHSPDLVDSIFITEKFLNQYPELIDDKFDVYIVPEHILDSLCDTKNPQGIVVVAKMDNSYINFDNMSLIVYLDNVSDPGNVGTIIRTADAAGVDLVLMSPNCADIYNSKTVRSTMGSLFHINVLYEEDYLKSLKDLKKNGFNIVTGSLDGKLTPYKADLTKKIVICMGNEAHGVSNDVIDLGVTKVKIPIIGKAESLNVSTAAAVLMFEAVRQRGYANV